MKKEKYIALLSFVFCVSLIVGLSIACSTAQELEQKKALEEQKKSSAKHKENFNSVITRNDFKIS